MVLVLNKDHYFYIFMCEGLGSNTRDELLSLFSLLQFALLIGISDISIIGDYNVLESPLV